MARLQKDSVQKGQQMTRSFEIGRVNQWKSAELFEMVFEDYPKWQWSTERKTPICDFFERLALYINTHSISQAAVKPEELVIELDKNTMEYVIYVELDYEVEQIEEIKRLTKECLNENKN